MFGYLFSFHSYHKNSDRANFWCGNDTSIHYVLFLIFDVIYSKRYETYMHMFNIKLLS
jgi:hypothetical protein